jgi:hypothetical protein
VIDYKFNGVNNTHKDPNTVLGPEDDSCSPGAVSLGGNGGYIIIGMNSGEEIIDGVGNDFRVNEVDKTYCGSEAEPYTVYISASSASGPWLYIGEGNGTTDFNIGGK